MVLNYFSYLLLLIVNGVIKALAYNLNVMRYSACLVDQRTRYVIQVPDSLREGAAFTPERSVCTTKKHISQVTYRVSFYISSLRDFTSFFLQTDDTHVTK